MPGADEVLAFDPGLNVGIALVASDGALVAVRTTTFREAVATEIGPCTTVLVGDGTGSSALVSALIERGLEPEVVDEAGTTLVARELYWQQNPARWPMRLLPVALRPLPRGIDGYAAWALARRWLNANGGQ